MKPQVQSRIGKNGRCLNACLASILEIPEHSVPDFPDGDVYFPAIDAFLKPFGVHYIQRPITEAPPKNWHTIEGVSPRGGMHAVCGYNGKFKFDPHPVEDDPRRGLVKPERWGCLVPISEEVKPVGDVALSKKAFAYEKWLVTLKCTSGKTGIKKGTTSRWIMSAGSPEQAMKLAVKTQVYPEFWRAIKAVPYDGGTVGDSVLRPKDIKRGPGAFTVQLTDPDGSEHVEPVSSLRTYDSKHVKDGLLEQLCQKHDAIKWHPSRNDDLAVPLRSSEALQAYAHTHSDIVRLLQDAVSLLNKSSAVNKANWRGRVERVKKDVATAEAKARGGDYKGAVALQESALMLAHEILDELLRLSRSKAVGGKATDFLPQYGESSKPHKFVPMDNSTRFCKVCARPLAASCHSVPAKDGLLSNTAILLAALYAWYRSRMDAPAQQPRNYDLTTYVPRQRLLDAATTAYVKKAFPADKLSGGMLGLWQGQELTYVSTTDKGYIFKTSSGTEVHVDTYYAKNYLAKRKPR